MINKELKIYEKIIKRDLINKIVYKKITELPNIFCITLHFGCKNQDLKSIMKSSFTLELITGKKSNFTTSKKQNIYLKTKKGSISGSLVKLRNKKMNFFYFRLITEILPKAKIPLLKIYNYEKSYISFNIPFSKLSCFEEIEFFAHLLKNFSSLNISILFNKPLTKNEQKLFASSL